MLNRFIRNATAAQSPVKISGVAATNVELSANVLPKPVTISRQKVCNGE